MTCFYVVDAVPIKNMIGARESALFMTINCRYLFYDINVTIVVHLVVNCEVNNTVHNSELLSRLQLLFFLHHMLLIVGGS